MNNVIHADIFFFISSIGFVVLFIMLVIIGVYMIQLSRTVVRISKKVEQDIDTIGDTAKDLVLDLKENSIFSLLFRKRKKYTK